MPRFHLKYGGTYTVTGVPVVINDLSNAITGSIGVLLIAALLVMAIVLLLVFRSRLRLLPLAIALAAVGITFGATSLVGGSLTMASIAVLPILIGLGVDYAVQFQSRTQEMLGDEGAAAPASGLAWAGHRPGGGGRCPGDCHRGGGHGHGLSDPAALPGADGSGIRRSARGRDRGRAGLRADGRGGRHDRGRPPSCPGPAVIVDSFARGRGDPQGPERRHGRGGGDPARLGPGGGPSGPPRANLRSGGRQLDRNGPASPAERPSCSRGRRSATAVARPGRVLAVGLLLAVLGWVADTQTSVQSDVTKLVPSNMPALTRTSTRWST